MKVLAFDSCAKAASAAVTDGERLLGEYTIDNGLTQSELLLPMAENLLKSLGLTVSDIDLFGVSVGPGSFTGVRIGVALVKGLAFGTDKPTSPVSTIEALAENLAGVEGIIVPCMDARRGQVYCGIFSSSGGGIKRLTEDMALPVDELYKMLGEYADLPIYIVGDGYKGTRDRLAELGLPVRVTPEGLVRESGYSVARVALRMYESGLSVPARELAPTYLRMPQAERERLERLSADKEF